MEVPEEQPIWNNSSLFNHFNISNCEINGQAFSTINNYTVTRWKDDLFHEGPLLEEKVPTPISSSPSI
jgi:hypothetical protein